MAHTPLLQQLPEDYTRASKHVGAFYVLSILHHEVHLLANILSTNISVLLVICFCC